VTTKEIKDFEKCRKSCNLAKLERIRNQKSDPQTLSYCYLRFISSFKLEIYQLLIWRHFDCTISTSDICASFWTLVQYCFAFQIGLSWFWSYLESWREVTILITIILTSFWWVW